MGILRAGDKVREGSFINASERDVATPANDLDKVPRLEDDGKIDPSFINGSKVIRLVAGENLSKRDSVFLAKSAYSRHTYNTNTGSNIFDVGSPTTVWRANIYTTPNIADVLYIKKLITYIEKSGSSSSGGSNLGEYTAYVYEIDGSNNPTGSPLQTSDIRTISTWAQGNGELEINFPTPVALTKNTNYAIVIKYYTTDGDDWALKGGGTPTDFVTSKNSTDGTTWTAGSGAFYMKLDWSMGEPGKVYKTSAKYYATSDFLGFVAKDVLAEEDAFVIKGNEIIGFSGLTTDTYYYLSDTNGEIDDSPGTVSKKIAYSNSTSSVIFDVGGQNFNRYDIAQDEFFPFDGFLALEYGRTSNGSETFTLKDDEGNTIRTFTFSASAVDSPANISDFDVPTTLYPVKRGWTINKACSLLDEIKII